MKLINTHPDYLLLVDGEAEIKEGDYQLVPMTEKIEIVNSANIHLSYMCYKVIAYRKLNEKAKELDLLLLPNPFDNQIDEVTYLKNLGNECFLKMKELNPSGGIKEFIRMAVEFGYKAAQSKQFSLEDVENILFGYDSVDWSKREHKQSTIMMKEWLNEKIQSLSTQQLPKEFVLSDKFSTFEENLKNGEYKW